MNKLAFIDVETTGSSPYYDRVIDVGVVLYENGKVIETWESLVNPGMSLSPIITNITGIMDEDLRNAPRFEEIAWDLLQRLEGRVFVGHNAAFDYTFIRQEFLRIGEKISLPQLCTVKLSRNLFPEETKHNLDALMDRFELTCDSRHRALPDADVTCQFFDKVHQIMPIDLVQNKVSQLIRRPMFPSRLNLDVIEALPEAHGVYIMYDDQGKTVFVGRADNIREKVFSLFYSDMSGNKHQALLENVVHVEAVTTAGEMESYFKVVELRNQQSKNGHSSNLVSTVVLKKNEDGYLEAEIGTNQLIGINEVRKTFVVFKNLHYLKRKLKDVCERDQLCLKLMGLEVGEGPCSGVDAGVCGGACMGNVSPSEYNLHVQKAFYDRQIKTWPFSGPVAYYEEDSQTMQRRIHVFDQWCYLGSFDDIADFYEKYPEGYDEVLFDIDVYTMLRKFFSNRWKIRKFKPVGNGVTS